MSEQLTDLSTIALVKEAQSVYRKHFPLTTRFERAIFFSWSCAIKDCGFCYMATQEFRNRNDDDKSLRSEASMYAEALLCKLYGWDIGFFSGGIMAFPYPKLLEIVRNINKIVGKKIWINIGALPLPVLTLFKDDIAGVVGSLETVNWELHKKVCPSKPYQPYLTMFEHAQKLGLATSMTFIVGLGETRDDFTALCEVITRYKISKIHLYCLIPHPGTMYAHVSAPSADEQAWWIAKTRIAFPTLDIQCGIWTDRIERVHVLLEAGANTISKFPVIRSFGSPAAHAIETEASLAGRTFTGTLTTILEIDFDAEVAKLDFLSSAMRMQVREKIAQYLKQMRKGKGMVDVVGE